MSGLFSGLAHARAGSLEGTTEGEQLEAARRAAIARALLQGKEFQLKENADKRATDAAGELSKYHTDVTTETHRHNTEMESAARARALVDRVRAARTGRDPMMPDLHKFSVANQTATAAERAAALMQKRIPQRPGIGFDSPAQESAFVADSTARAKQAHAAQENAHQARHVADSLATVITNSRGAAPTYDATARAGSRSDLPPLTQAQRAKAASDPDYRAFLASKGYDL